MVACVAWAAWRPALTLLLALFLPVAEAAGQVLDSPACRRSCGAALPERALNPTSVQACLIRCTAAERHLARQGQRGTPEATGRGATPASPGSAAAAAPTGSAARRVLVAYAATLPARGLAISTPGERMTAHRIAEATCRRQSGSAPCRPLVETADRCLAVAQGVRATAVVITADPRSFIVSHYGTGTGAEAAAAEAAALRDCAGRLGPGLTCRLAATSCG